MNYNIHSFMVIHNNCYVLFLNNIIFSRSLINNCGISIKYSSIYLLNNCFTHVDVFFNDSHVSIEAIEGVRYTRRVELGG